MFQIQLCHTYMFYFGCVSSTLISSVQCRPLKGSRASTDFCISRQSRTVGIIIADLRSWITRLKHWCSWVLSFTLWEAPNKSINKFSGLGVATTVANCKCHCVAQIELCQIEHQWSVWECYTSTSQFHLWCANMIFAACKIYRWLSIGKRRQLQQPSGCIFSRGLSGHCVTYTFSIWQHAKTNRSLFSNQ